MAQNIPEHTWDKKVVCGLPVWAVVTTPHYWQKGDLQLSGVEAFIYFHRHAIIIIVCLFLYVVIAVSQLEAKILKETVDVERSKRVESPKFLLSF